MCLKCIAYDEKEDNDTNSNQHTKKQTSNRRQSKNSNGSQKQVNNNRYQYDDQTSYQQEGGNQEESKNATMINDPLNQIPMTVKFPPINKRAEDWQNYDPEEGQDVAYYNFDSNVPLLAYSINKKLKYTNRGHEQSHIQRRKLIALQRRRKAELERMSEEKEKVIEEEFEVAQNANISQAAAIKLRKQYKAKEKEMMLDRDNITVRALFASEGPDGKGRRLYMFYLNQNSSIIDLKSDIKKDFGWDTSQINIYFNYEELHNHESIMKIENFDNEEDVLLVLMNEKRPETKLPIYLKTRMDDIKMTDVKFFNSAGVNELLENRDEGHEFPEYYDWNTELIELNNSIFMAKSELDTNPSDQDSLDLLIDAEKSFHELNQRFEKAAIQAVRTIVETQSTPINIFNLYGDGGKKHVSAGLFIRHLDEWRVLKKYVCNKNQSKKLSSHNIKAFSLLRHQVRNLIVPLCCIVEYRGEAFEVQSLSPISINTLVYGSDNHGLTFTIKDVNAEEIAIKIWEKFNLKPHEFKQFYSINEKREVFDIYLPFLVQIHRSSISTESDSNSETVNYYIINPGALFWWDTILSNESDAVTGQITKQLRPEWIMNNHADEVADGYTKQTWKSPTRCFVWGHFIQEYEYYYFEKRNLDANRSIITQLYCCPECFIDVQTEINSGVSSNGRGLGNKYPWHKFERKELSHNKRGEFWFNETTGNIVKNPPYKKIPLNPDAWFNSFGIESSEEDIGDIIKSRRKMLDQVLVNIIEDLDNSQLDIKTPEELYQMFKTVGINMRHIQKVVTISQKQHVKQLAITELLARKIKNILVEGKSCKKYLAKFIMEA